MVTKSFVLICISVSLGISATSGWSHPADENPDISLPESTREYRQDRFGIRYHWGLFSLLCDGEQVAEERKISPQDYSKLAPFFNPAEFDAREWARLAKAAGANYVIAPAKGRDGFALWKSKVSDWNVAGRTPFARDFVNELSDSCHREGIKLYLQYCVGDWYRPADASEAADSGTTATDEATSAPGFVMQEQVRELLRGYNKIHGLHLEVWPSTPEANSAVGRLMANIRRLQPNALIGIEGLTDNKEQNFEIKGQKYLAERTVVSSGTLSYSAVPAEVNVAVNDSFGYRLTDTRYKLIRELVHTLVQCAGRDANMVLNVGVMPNGKLDKACADSLKLMGMWLAKNGDSIYATRGGPIPPQSWGVTTHRRNRVYVHVTDPETTTVTLQLPTMLRTARYLSDESEVTVVRDGDNISLGLRPEQRGELERIVILETKQYD